MQEGGNSRGGVIVLYDFMIKDVMLAADGELDARKVLSEGGYFLLSHTGNVLFANAAEGLPLVGEQFFEALGTARGECDVLQKTLLRGAREPYLMQCGRTPVLLLRLPYCGNLTLLAAIPPESVAQALRYPASYAEILGYPIKFSPLSVAAIAPSDEHAYLLIRDWLQTVMPAVGGTVLREEKAIQLANVLQRRLCGLARFTGMLVQFDFSTLSYGTVLGVDDALLAAMLSAVLFALSALSLDRAVHIAAVRDSMGEPRLHVRVYSEEAIPSDELTALLQPLAFRGMKWQCYRDPAIMGLWHISLPLCAKELSLQQLRNYFGY